MTSFVLKIIAVISMVCDHVGDSIVHKLSFLNVIGRIAFPIFAFQISEGYRHTHNLKNYFIRLGIFAGISQIPFMLFLSTFNPGTHTFNIFCTLFLGLLAITLFDKFYYVGTNASVRPINAETLPLRNSRQHKFLWKLLGIFSVVLMMAIAHFTSCDYGWYGVAIIFIFYYFKKHLLWLNLSFMTVTGIKYIQYYTMAPSIWYVYLFIATCTSLIFIHLYNEKKGKSMKYFLYIFYPAHLLLLYFINYLLNG